MNNSTKEVFANHVLDRLTDLNASQRNCVKEAIMEEIDNYVIYTPEEAAEIIQEPLKLLDEFFTTQEDGRIVGRNNQIVQVQHYALHQPYCKEDD